MTRKGRKQSNKGNPPIQNRAKWSEEDLVELLAWLDYTLLNHESGIQFKSSISNHLRKTRHKEYTVVQVERKLERLWVGFGRFGGPGKEEIYQLGSKCLVCLDSDIKSKIYARLKMLRDYALVEIINSPRQLRSVSRVSDSKYAYRPNPRVEIASIPPARKRQYRLLSSEADLDDYSPSKRRDTHNPLKEETFENVEEQNSTQDTITDSEGQQTDINDCSSPSPTNTGEHGTRSSLEAFSTVEIYRPVQVNDTRTLEKREQSDQQKYADNDELHGECSLEQECQSLRARLETLQREHHDEVRYHRDQALQSEKDRKKLQRNLDCLESSSRVLSQADQNTTLKILYDKQVEIHDLNEKLQDTDWLRTFSSLASKDRLPLDTRRVRSEMSAVNSSIKQILSGHQGHNICTVTDIKKNNDLKILLRRSLGLNPSDPFDLLTSGTALSGFGFQVLVRSLIVAALCQWVFETNLPELFITHCALLEKYRSNLAKQDGENALRNLDFASHQSLIEEDFFQKHVIPNRAAALAEQLFIALTPLFTPNDEHSNSYLEKLRAWSEEKESLNEVFERALKIKTSTIVSMDLFEVVLYSPGTSFERKIMVAETIEGDQAQLSSYESPTVKLCVLPAFHVYGDDRKLVDGANFVQRDADQRARSYMITKAVVVLESSGLQAPE